MSRAEKTFGREPNAIVLTHGYFDHAGAAKELAERWDVPVYAHRLEFPYLTGDREYRHNGGLLCRGYPSFCIVKHLLDSLPE